MAQVEYRVFGVNGSEDLEAKLNEAAKAGFRLAQVVYQSGPGATDVIVERPVPTPAMDPPDAD